MQRGGGVHMLSVRAPLRSAGERAGVRDFCSRADALPIPLLEVQWIGTAPGLDIENHFWGQTGSHDAPVVQGIEVSVPNDEPNAGTAAPFDDGDEYDVYSRLQGDRNDVAESIRWNAPTDRVQVDEEQT